MPSLLITQVQIRDQFYRLVFVDPDNLSADAMQYCPPAVLSAGQRGWYEAMGLRIVPYTTNEEGRAVEIIGTDYDVLCDPKKQAYQAFFGDDRFIEDPDGSGPEFSESLTDVSQWIQAQFAKAKAFVGRYVYDF